MGLLQRLLRPRKLLRSFKKSIIEFFRELLSFLAFIWLSLKELCYKMTLPVTRRTLSRKPVPPKAVVQDIRANRIRFDIESSFSSMFNVEVFEIEWAPCSAPPEEWNSVGFSDIQQRTVARLQGDTAYRFRFRAKNEKGVSGWSKDVVAKTKQEPIEGGGHGPRYTWTQTATDVTITFKLHKSTTKSDIRLSLRTDHLKLLVSKPQGCVDAWDEVVMDGPLYGKVASFDNGSFWELIKEDGTTVVNVMLEKLSKSVAPKFDYWRSIHPGHPELEIDSHKILSGDAESGGMQMLQPGQMDPEQLRALGLNM